MRELKFGRKPTPHDRGIACNTYTKPPKISEASNLPDFFAARVIRTLSAGDRDAKIQQGQRHGRLRILKARRNVGGVLFFSCRCDCGSKIWINHAGLDLRRRKSAGCLQSGCCFTPLKHRVWFDFEVAVRLQWKQIVNGFSGLTDNAWGGELASDLDPDPDGYDAFRSWVEGQRPPLSEWWVERIDTRSVWADWNCRLTDLPDSDLFRAHKMPINYYGASLSAKEWSRILGIPAGTIVQLFQAGDADDVIDQSSLYGTDHDAPYL